MRRNIETNDWFHGTAADFDVFQEEWIGHGDDQLGSGFYFTDNCETAEHYATRRASLIDAADAVVLVTRLAIRNPLPSHARITEEQIGRIIRAAPDYGDALQNFGDVGHEGASSVLRDAVRVYASQNTNRDDDTLQMLFCISNDFYRTAPARFLRAMTDVTGYDGLVRDVGDERHAVAWDPAQIIIQDRRPLIQARQHSA